MSEKLHKYLEQCGEWVEEENGDKFFILSNKSSPFFPSVFRYMNRKMSYRSYIDEIKEEEKDKKFVIKYSKINDNHLLRYVGISKVSTPDGTKKMLVDITQIFKDSVNFTKRFKEVYEC